MSLCIPPRLSRSTSASRPLSLAVLLLSLVTPASGEQPSQGEPHHARVLAGTGEPPSDEAAYEPGLPSGDASRLRLGTPFGVEPWNDSLLITTVSDHCLWKLELATGNITRIAGNGTRGYHGDGGPAVEAAFDWPHEVRADAAGNLFVADTRNQVVRRIDATTQVVTTLAGTGESGFAGDGAAAVDARLNQPHSVVLDHAGGLLIADTLNHRVRRVDLATGTITTIAGTGEKRLPREGQIAAEAPLFGPRSLAVDESSIWIALREGNSIWRIDRAAGTLHHVAGTGQKGQSADGGTPASATFHGPKGLVVDRRGRIIVADTENHLIRRIDLAANTVNTLRADQADGTPVKLARPHGVTVLATGEVVVGDSENHRVVAWGDR